MHTSGWPHGSNKSLKSLREFVCRNRLPEWDVWGCGAVGTLVRHWVGMKNGAAAMENGMGIPQKIKNKSPIWSSISGCICKEWKQGPEVMFVDLCSQQHYSQWPKGRSNASALCQTNEKGQMWPVRTHSYVLFSLKKDGILTCGTEGRQMRTKT